MGASETSSFLSWFTTQGGTYDAENLGLTHFPCQGIGAIALQDIPKDHTLFSIPRDLTLSLRTSSLPPAFGLSEWKAAGLAQGWAGLILCMMWESSKGKESKWHGYLDSMPVSFSTPMLWTEQELLELKGTAVVDKVGRDDAEKDYREKVLPAIQARPDLFPASAVNTFFSMEWYHIMGSRILSRSFHVEKWDSEDADAAKPEGGDDAAMQVDQTVTTDDTQPQKPNHDQDGAEGEDDEAQEEEEEEEDIEDPSDVAMVPMADALNARYGSENAKLFYEEHCLKMVSTKPIASGEQIWNTYGDPPNSDLLRRYGHVDLVALPQGGLGNPADIVEVRADLVVSVAKEDVDQERIEWWLEEGGDDVFILDSDLEVPDTMVSLIKLVLLSPSEWQKAKQKGKPPKPKIDTEVLEIAVRILTHRLSEYPTTLQHDEELLTSKDSNLSTNYKNALIVRAGEKRILSTIFDMQMKQLKAAQQKPAGDTKRRRAEDLAQAVKSAKKAKR